MASTLSAPVAGPTMSASTDDDAPSDATTIVVPFGDNHTHTIIFLHGREDFGEDLAQYFFDSKASDGSSLAERFPSVKWVFPTAKLRYSVQRDFEFSSSSFAELLKGEEIISQWFDVWDIKAPDDKQELMISGLQESIQDIAEIIREEAELVPLERIILGGISQGCATGIYTLLSCGMNLGGFIGLSSWLPFQNIIENIALHSTKDKDELSRHIQTILQMSKIENDTEHTMSDSKEHVPEIITRGTDDLETQLSNLSLHQESVVKTPIFLAHSRDDETVPFTHGQGLYENIKNLGFDVTWKEYEDGGHWIHSKYGVDDISIFLHKIMDI